MHRDALRTGSVLVGALLLASTLSAAGASAATHAKYGDTTRQSERAAIARVKWMSNVTVTKGNGSWTFVSDGLPSSSYVATDYAVPANPFDVSAAGATVVASSSVLTDQHYDYTLPLTPVYSKKVTTTNQGPIGFLLDGAALFNPYEANHQTVATSDNFVATENGVSASFLDSCDGHPGPGGQYHYHGLPTCLVAYATGTTVPVASVTSTAGTTTAGVDEDNAAAKVPVILGFAFDGFGIYDNVAMNGTTVAVSSLDACNGIFSAVPGYPKGVYHYVLENVKGARSSIGCYHGIVSSAYTKALRSALDGPSSPSAAVRTSATPRVAATAQSLAANQSVDQFLVTMLRIRGAAGVC